MQKKVLIVDDYELTAQITALLFTELGYLAQIAYTAEDALKFSSSNHDYSIILLDINLPDRSGLELASLLRSNENLSHTKIFAFTGCDNYDMEHYKQHGINGLILKPLNREKLSELLTVL
jgi:CheY-like chemotaxis protein